MADTDDIGKGVSTEPLRFRMPSEGSYKLARLPNGLRLEIYCPDGRVPWLQLTEEQAREFVGYANELMALRITAN